MTPIDAPGLRRLIGGDLSLLPTLRETSPDDLLGVARETAGPMVTVDAVTRVLEARRAGSASAAETWRWAKLLLHKTHPYTHRPRGPDSDPEDLTALWE